MDSVVARLLEDGYESAPRDGYFIVPGIRYRNTQMMLSTGDLITEIDAAGQPVGHVVYLAGEDEPAAIEKVSVVTDQRLFGSISAKYRLSSKPDSGYPGLYEKMIHYISLITRVWNEEIEQATTENTVEILKERLAYHRSLETSAGTEKFTQLLKDLRIGIVGIGGTGSYVLDFIAKLPVKEILICDDDVFFEKNAFRSPGAAPFGEIKKEQIKVEYFAKMYSDVHKKIQVIAEKIHDGNLHHLAGLNYVFVCIDNEVGRKPILEYLAKENIPFVDVGMALSESNGRVYGSLRVTSPSFLSEIEQAQSQGDEGKVSENIYSRTLMFSELNALNAALAVIRWKKDFGIYVDHDNEYLSQYSIGDNYICNKKIEKSADDH